MWINHQHEHSETNNMKEDLPKISVHFDYLKRKLARPIIKFKIYNELTHRRNKSNIIKEKKQKKRENPENRAVFVPLLSSSIPYLSLDSFLVNVKRLGLKFNSNCGLGIQTELIPSKTRKELGFADCRIPDQDNLENIINLLIEIGLQIRHI